MKTVRIAELKARLSEYLREVRRGRTFTVLDRETPIARLVPYEDAPALTVRRPAPGAPTPGEFRWPPPLDLRVDAVALLLEERQAGR
jgi:prevent-host-death family protein